MSQRFATPQDAEDALYDAIEARDLSALLAVWEASEEVACLLPMQPLVQGHSALSGAWEPLFTADLGVDIEVLHIRWLELGDVAIHYLQERATVAGQPQPPVYATNLYRRGDEGWHLILHQNSPTPPPPGMLSPGPALRRPPPT